MIPCHACGEESTGVGFIDEILRPVCTLHNILFKRASYPREAGGRYPNVTSEIRWQRLNRETRRRLRRTGS